MSDAFSPSMADSESSQSSFVEPIAYYIVIAIVVVWIGLSILAFFGVVIITCIYFFPKYSCCGEQEKKEPTICLLITFVVLMIVALPIIVSLGLFVVMFFSFGIVSLTVIVIVIARSLLLVPVNMERNSTLNIFSILFILLCV